MPSPINLTSYVPVVDSAYSADNEADKLVDEAAPHANVVGNRLAAISWNLCFATLPMAVLTAVLLVLVLKYRVDVAAIPQPQLVSSTLLEELRSSHYVNLSSSLLVFISSWSSTIAPICGTFLITLASYPICKAYLARINRGNLGALPTPYQLSLIIRFLSGSSFGALWSWLVYSLHWRKRQQTSVPMKQVAMITIAAVFISLLVFLADTWLHISTKSVNVPFFTTVEKLPILSFGLSANYSSPKCATGLEAVGCALQEHWPSLRNESMSFRVLYNVSSFAVVQSYTNEMGSFAYYSAPQDPNTSLTDYTATTFGLQTQCRPSTQQCNATNSNGFMSFNCSSVFSSHNMNQPWAVAYFDNSSMTSNRTMIGLPWEKGPSVAVSSPYYFGYAGNTGPIASQSLLTDPDALTLEGMAGGAGLGFVLLCNSTVFDISYDRFNGSITQFNVSQSNETVTNYVQAPMSRGKYGYLQFQVVTQALASTSSSMQEVAQGFADSYSTTALAIAAQMLQPIPVVAAQKHSVRLLTKLEPKALYTLVAINLTFIITGIVLAAIAIFAVSDSAVRDLQSRLSVGGIVAECFEGFRADYNASSLSNIFEESDNKQSVRITVLPSGSGGLRFRAK